MERLTPGHALRRVQGRISSARRAGMAHAPRGPTLNSRGGLMNQEQQSSQSAVKTSEAMIRGAAAIAEYMFGDRRYRRRVYHLVQTSRIPIARIGSPLCLRPSTYQK